MILTRLWNANDVGFLANLRHCAPDEGIVAGGKNTFARGQGTVAINPLWWIVGPQSGVLQSVQDSGELLQLKISVVGLGGIKAGEVC